MIKLSLTTALAALLLGNAALAAPMLKSEITVAGSIVTVGDMFDDAGLAAEDALFLSPNPGTTGTVPLIDVMAAAARIGLVNFDSRGLASVSVTRAAAIVDETVLAGLIEADLTHRGIITAGMSADLRFSTPIEAITAEAVDEPARVVSVRYMPGNGAFSARFTVAGSALPIDVTGTVELMIEAPHLVGNLSAGAVLTADDVVMRPVPLRFAESTGVTQFVDVVGMALTRSSRDGMMLKPSDVTTPLLIAKNDLVTIYFRKGPMTLTVKGQAITGAATGSPLQVLNLMSRRVISATALAPGAVEVNADPLSLAGL